MCVAYKGIILWLWRESTCMYGWQTCCYTWAVVCRESVALLRFAVYISELLSRIMSALDFLTLKLLHWSSTLLALPFALQSVATFTSPRRPFPFSLIKKCRLVSVLLSERRQFGSWNSSSSCKQQQFDSLQAQRSSQWRFQIIMSLSIYVIAALFQQLLARFAKLPKRLSASFYVPLYMQQLGSRWMGLHWNREKNSGTLHEDRCTF